MINVYRVTVTTTGSSGSATGSAESEPFVGKILSVQLDPHASLPSTADTVVYVTKDGDRDTNVETLSTFTNSGNTEGVLKRYPIKEADDGAGSSVAASNKSNVWVPFTTFNGVHVEVVQGDALTDAIVVTIVIEQ